MVTLVGRQEHKPFASFDPSYTVPLLPAPIELLLTLQQHKKKYCYCLHSYDMFLWRFLQSQLPPMLTMMIDACNIPPPQSIPMTPQHSLIPLCTVEWILQWISIVGKLIQCLDPKHYQQQQQHCLYSQNPQHQWQWQSLTYYSRGMTCSMRLLHYLNCPASLQHMPS